jgi:NitT/TauT family transport system substrate-binding protein
MQTFLPRGRPLTAVCLALVIAVGACAPTVTPAPPATAPATQPTSAQELKPTLASATLAPAASVPTAPPKKSLGKISFVQPSESLVFTALYIARDKGYFVDEGLDVDFQTVGGEQVNTTALLAGSAQFGVAGTSGVIDAVAQGRDLIMLSAMFSEISSNIVVRSDALAEKGVTPQSSIADRVQALRGLKIGTTSQTSTNHKVLRYLLLKNGLVPERDTTIVFLGDAATMPAALSKKLVDGYIVSSPTADIPVARGEGQILLAGTKGEITGLEGMIFMTVVSRREYVEKNPEITQAVVNAVVRGAQHARRSPADAKAAVRKFLSGVEDQVFDAGWENNFPGTLNVEVTTAGIAKVFELLEFIDGNKRPVTFEQLVANKYVDVAQRK